MTNTARYILAAILLLLALGCLFLPKDEEVALATGHPVSSAPHRLRLAGESTTPPSAPPHTTTPRASRSAHTTAPKAPRARSAPTPRPNYSGTLDAAFWRRLANCESPDGRSGTYLGYFQFSRDTARKVGYYPGASYEAQVAMAQKWLAMIGGRGGSRSGWPVCWWKAMAGG